MGAKGCTTRCGLLHSLPHISGMGKGKRISPANNEKEREKVPLLVDTRENRFSRWQSSVLFHLGKKFYSRWFRPKDDIKIPNFPIYPPLARKWRILRNAILQYSKFLFVRTGGNFRDGFSEVATIAVTKNNIGNEFLPLLVKRLAGFRDMKKKCASPPSERFYLTASKREKLLTVSIHPHNAAKFNSEDNKKVLLEKNKKGVSFFS